MNMKQRMTNSKCGPLEDQRGSATSEFVLLALPLFIPALIFFVSISQVSRAEMEVSMLAREALKAFTTGQDDIEGHLRVRLLLNKYTEISGRGTSPGSTNELSRQSQNSKGGNLNSSELRSTSRIDYSIRCTTSPCILPGAEVEITLFSIIDLESELTSLTSSPSKHWGTGQEDVDKQRLAVASARGFVDKWK